MNHLGMELETKNSAMGVQKITALFGIIFCAVVAVLLLVLYYPFDSAEKEFEEDFAKMTTVDNSVERVFTNTGYEETFRTRLENAARSLEEFGAAFLSLLAIGCVTVGLTCLFCACCLC